MQTLWEANAMLCNVAIPMLPSRDLSRTIAFYQKLGFQVSSDPNAQDLDYSIVSRETIELHFFRFAEIIPAESYAGCYLRVRDVDSLFREFQIQSLPFEGIPRLGKIANQPWGMREFHLVDLDGNLIKIGQVIAA
jgi:catechol 2,3-dioxygenase-like lactoylglutathione lyase family enzyme